MSKCGCCAPRSGHKVVNVYKESNPYSINMKGVVDSTYALPENAENFDAYFVADESIFYVAYNGEWLPTSPEEHEHGVWCSYVGGPADGDALTDGGFYFVPAETDVESNQ